MRVHAGGWLVVAGMAGCAAAATAQVAPADRVLGSLTGCRGIPQPDARLACFERGVDALEAQVRDRTVRIVDRQEVAKARRSLFGFTLPRIDLFDTRRTERGGRPAREERDDEFSEINASVASASELRTGRAEIRLAEDGGGTGGAVWQTTEPMTFPPKAGAKVRIRQASLGGYTLTVEGRTYRAMRVR